MFNIKNLVQGYHKSARSVAELVPWMALWDSQTVLNIDASALAIYEYSGFEGQGRSFMENDSLVGRYERAFRAFGSEMVAWNIVDRRRHDAALPDESEQPIARGVNRAYREGFENGRCYRNTYSLAIQARASRGTDAVFDTVDALMKEEDLPLAKALFRAMSTQYSPKKRREFNTRTTETLTRRLETRVAELEDALTFLGLKRLSGEELLTYLHHRLNPATPGQRVRMPAVPAYLNTYLMTDHIRRQPGYLTFDNDRRKFATLITVRGWPDFTVPGALDAILAVDGEVTISHCFRFLDKDVAEKIIRDTERHNLNLSVPLFSRISSALMNQEPTRINSGRLQLAEDAQAALASLTSGERVFGYHNITIVCYGDTREEMQSVRTQIMRLLKNHDYLGIAEGMHALSSFAGTLPGQWAASVRWENVSFANAADLAPLNTVRPGSAKSSFLTEKRGQGSSALTVFRTEYGTAKYFDPFESGVGHGFVVGPTGGGKTTFVNFLLSQWRRYEPCRSYVFDKRYSSKITTILHGGQHVDLSPHATQLATLNPFSLITDERHWPFLSRWVQDRLSSRGYVVTADDAKNVYSAIQALAATGSEEGYRLSGLTSFLGPALSMHLGEWLEGREKGAYFDNTTDALELSGHVCFELGDIFNDPDVAEAAIDYLFYRIEQQLTDGKPTLIYLEEIWFFLRNQKMATRYDDWLRTMRKLTTGVWAATQMSAEIMKSDYFVTIADNVPNRIFLPNPGIMNSRALYKEGFGLNNEEITRLQQATPGHDYYVVTPSSKTMVNLRLPPEIVAVLRSDILALNLLEKHRATGHPDWDINYMHEILGRE